MPDNLTDPSRSTEQFRAFAQQGTGAPAKVSKNRLILIVAAVIAVVVIVAIVAAVA